MFRLRAPLRRMQRRAHGALENGASPCYRIASMRHTATVEQLALPFSPGRARWTFSRPAAGSRHLLRIQVRLEFVRRFFPELSASTIHVGLARKRGVLGWGSLDPEKPGVWVRPIRLDNFTVAHEFTHLLQARGLVPRGERSCDLFALARSPLLNDRAPGYLRLPDELRYAPHLSRYWSSLLHRAARRAIAARGRGDRRYLARFEAEIAAAPGATSPGAARTAPVRTTAAS